MLYCMFFFVYINNECYGCIIYCRSYQKMCLPLGCLKAYVGFGAFLSILVSLGLLGGTFLVISVSIYANLKKKQIVDQSSQSVVNHALIALYIGSITFFLLGLAGMTGACLNSKRKKQSTKSKCLICIYSIGVFVFLVAFILLSIFFLAGPHLIFGTDCRSGSKINLIKDLSIVYDKANNGFCKGQCGCYVPDSYLKNFLIDNNYVVSTNEKDPVKFQSCSTYAQEDDQESTSLALFEEILGCGGWCAEDVRFYKFYDITKCQTQDCLKGMDSCYDSFKSFLTDKSFLLGGSCLVATGITLINMIAIFCLCCHPTQKNRKDFYKRMLEDNE